MYTETKTVITSIPEGLKLNVGCGRRFLEGYVNIDSQPLSDDLDFFLTASGQDIEQSYLCCTSDNIPLADECASKIICDHVLEHQTPEEIYETLWEFARILQPEGSLEIKVPNFEYFIDKFDDYKEDYLGSIDVMYAILCNVRNKERMSPHRSLLWANFLCPLIERSGYEIVDVSKSEELFIKAARKSNRVVKVYGGKE